MVCILIANLHTVFFFIHILSQAFVQSPEVSLRTLLMYRCQEDMIFVIVQIDQYLKKHFQSNTSRQYFTFINTLPLVLDYV